MRFTLVTYGAGEILAETFNALAAVINGQSGTLYQPLARFGLIIGLLWAVISMLYGERSRFLYNWMIPLFVSLSLFFAPTCQVHIFDPVSGYRFNVDNVPWGLGCVAGIISQIGDTLTREIEKTFSLPDDLKYHKTGAVMASNLIASAKTFHVTNEDLSETLRSFMTQCVVYDALLGRKYTLDDLKNTPDLWRLAMERPSPARCFTYRAPGSGQNAEIMTCQRGATLLDQLLKRDVQNAFQMFESKLFGRGGGRQSTLGGARLKQYLPGAFNYMAGMAKSAEEHMLQQMMIYAVVDAIETKSSALGNAPNFAVRRAYLQQRANQETLAGIAAQKLIAMKNVMEALIYAAFIFILPLALLPMGWQFIGRWVSLVMWVQLWPPLYAILNFIMTISLRAKGLGLIATTGGVTIANSVGFMNLHADMAAQAGFMSIAIGALAYALVKGGAASFVHLASHLSGPSVAAAAGASESLMSGNYSFGNVSTGTVQAANTSLGQHLTSPSYSSGAFSQADGHVGRLSTRDGDHIVSIASSQLRSGIQLSENLSQSYTEQASKAHQTAENKLMAAAEAQAAHNRSLFDLSEHQAHQLSQGETHSTGTTASSNKSFQTLDTLVDRFAQDHSISKESASQMLAGATAMVETGTGFSVFGNGVSAKVMGTVSKQLTRGETDRNLLSAAQDYSQQSSFQEAMTLASRAAHDTRFANSHESGKRYVASLNTSSENSQQYREEASASLQQSQAFSEMASWTKQNAGSINANLNQEYVRWIQTQPLPNAKGPMGITEAETILSSRPELDHAYQSRFLEEKMQRMENHFATHGLPRASQDINQVFAQTGITSPVSTISPLATQAAQQGLGDTFKLGTKPKNGVKDQLASMSDQLEAQQEILKKGAVTRKQGVTNNQ